MHDAASAFRHDALFSVPSPRIDAAEAEALAADAFGVAGAVSALASERDQNFRVDAPDGSAYVLKLTHPAEHPGVTEFQTFAQLRVIESDGTLPVPRLLRDRAGRYIHWRGVAGGQTRQAVRLITFAPGIPLHRAERTARQRRALGAALGRFDRALRGFTHAHAGHRLLWDMQHLAQLRPLLDFVDGDERRGLARQMLDRHEDVTLRRLTTLRRQVIHNDLNPYNVLVDETDADRITAILDFGDMVNAPLVNELAVASSYQLADAANPLETAVDCICAYHRVNPLSGDELAVLPELIVARLLMTVLITGWRAREHPENSTYILRNNALSWNGLHRFAALPDGAAARTIRDAIRNEQEQFHAQ
ncbi:homoserine kinase [Burkholderia pseudomultivorans]|uniref:phosphotransferase n=1 Tax=Burkholderia pseudomultivorans TaxID=1207504 RepID=UPI000755D032|nr:phosphotransferase [Burkholderia pseudomultivorans]KVC36704.1 homoserine kinase [Burkholderia pseudomultivorans]